jgi:hypothetical protein
MARGLKLFAAVALTAFAASAHVAAAAPQTHLSGGGTATISQVAVNVSIGSSGSASGSFECLMAGRSGFVLPDFGLAHNMIVHATPTRGSVSGSVVTFADDNARLTLDGKTHATVHIEAWFDVATQTFQLTVIEVGSLPVETFLSGGVRLN